MPKTKGFLLRRYPALEYRRLVCYTDRMEVNKKTAFVKGAAILTIAGVICKVIGLLIRVFATRIFLEEGLYFYEKVFPTYSLLLIISSSGFPTAISRMVAERAAVGNYNGAKRVFRRSLLLLFLIGAVTSSFMFFGAKWIGTEILHGREGIEYSLMALAPALLFVSVICAFRGYLQGLQRMTGTSVSQLAEQVFKFIFGLFLVAYFFRRFEGSKLQFAASAAGLLLGVTISEILALIVIIIFYLRRRKTYTAMIEDPNPNEKILGNLLIIAVPITIGASILPLANQLDSFMIEQLLWKAGFSKSAAELSFTALSGYVRSLINLPATMTVGISMSIVPAISAARARQDQRDVQHLSLLGLKIAMAVGIPCAVGLSVLAGPIIKFLYMRNDPSFFNALAVAEPLMHVAAFTVIFISLAQTATGALQGLRRHWLPILFLLIGGVTKVIVNLVCIPIPKINVMGAVFSNLACFGVAGILDTIALLRVTKAKLNVLDTFLKPIVASALMGGAAWGVHRLLSQLSIFQGSVTSRIATLLAILVAIAVYAVFTVLFAMFTKEELAYIPGGRRLARFARR